MCPACPAAYGSQRPPVAILAFGEAQLLPRRCASVRNRIRRGPGFRSPTLVLLYRGAELPGLALDAFTARRAKYIIDHAPQEAVDEELAVRLLLEGTAMAKSANELRLETLKAELLSMPTTDPRYKAIAREASDTLFKISDERRNAAGLPTLEQALQQRAEERLKNPDARPPATP